MKMLTGLLPASEGAALLFGRPLDASDLGARKRVGYMSQSFSLYSELTVRQNLQLHARLFHLPVREGKARIAELIERFGLADHVDQRAEDLPLGIRQRLSLAVAIVHEPEILILDEPTSGVDPLARDRFWELLIDLSRNEGVTIFVSTHFMNEAERCDRISLMDSGRVLATDTSAGLSTRARAPLRSRMRSSATSKRRGDRVASSRRRSPPPWPKNGGTQRRAAAAERGLVLQPAAPGRLTDPRDAGTGTRSDPGRVRLVRHRLHDARFRVRHLDRRQQSYVRCARSRSEPRKPRLSRGIARLDLLR